MFAEYVYEMSSAQYFNRLLLIDNEKLNILTNYAEAFSAHGFETVYYLDDLSFRMEYEDKLKKTDIKLAVIVSSDVYVPYDIYNSFRTYDISLEKLFYLSG